MNKFQRFVMVLQIALFSAELRTRNGAGAACMAEVLEQGPAHNLETIVNTYGIVESDDPSVGKVDSKPVIGMVDEYIAFKFGSGHKPEWLAHAGL